MRERLTTHSLLHPPSRSKRELPKNVLFSPPCQCSEEKESALISSQPPEPSFASILHCLSSAPFLSKKREKERSRIFIISRWKKKACGGKNDLPSPSVASCMARGSLISATQSPSLSPFKEERRERSWSPLSRRGKRRERERSSPFPFSF